MALVGDVAGNSSATNISTRYQGFLGKHDTNIIAGWILINVIVSQCMIRRKKAPADNFLIVLGKPPKADSEMQNISKRFSFAIHFMSARISRPLTQRHSECSVIMQILMPSTAAFRLDKTNYKPRRASKKKGIHGSEKWKTIYEK